MAANGVRAAIVGGGVAGVALAKNLAQAGYTVTLVERGPQLCSGATCACLSARGASSVGTGIG